MRSSTFSVPIEAHRRFCGVFRDAKRSHLVSVPLEQSPEIGSICLLPGISAESPSTSTDPRSFS